MPRKENPVPTVTFTVSTTPAVKSYLEMLVTKGLYGKTVPEVTDRLLSEAIRRLIVDGELKQK